MYSTCSCHSQPLTWFLPSLVTCCIHLAYQVYPLAGPDFPPPTGSQGMLCALTPWEQTSTWVTSKASWRTWSYLYTLEPWFTGMKPKYGAPHKSLIGLPAGEKQSVVMSVSETPTSPFKKLGPHKGMTLGFLVLSIHLCFGGLQIHRVPTNLPFIHQNIIL